MFRSASYQPLGVETRIRPWTPYEGLAELPELEAVASASRAINPIGETRAERDLKPYPARTTVAEHGRTSCCRRRRRPRRYHSQIAPTLKAQHRPRCTMPRSIRWSASVCVVRCGIRVNPTSPMERCTPLRCMHWYLDGGRPGASASSHSTLSSWHHSVASREQLGHMGSPTRRTPHIPNTGMAVTTDIGDLKDIHPRNKRDVGERLARWALSHQYGVDIPFSGPIYAGHEVRDEAIVISFTHADGGLAYTGDQITDVYVLGEGDDAFVPATPTISGNQLIVTHPSGSTPVHVRMGWNTDAQPNLTNQHGLPAAPFRTDRQSAPSTNRAVRMRTLPWLKVV